jgi:predicted alpha/beta superfamily hydrolase
MRARWDVAGLLLEHAPDVNAIGDDGGSPLNWAAHHDNVEFIGKMLDKGANPDARNQWGMTSLHTAAWRGCVNIARLMLDRGADPEIRTNEGWTVLHMAYRSGHQEVIDLLLERGARTDVKDNEGRTPRELQFHKPPASEMKPSELDEYVGTYRYKDTSFTLLIWREGSQLHLMEYGPDRIYPAKKDLFYCAQAPWTLTFSRDESGSVSKVHLQFIRKGYDMVREPESPPVDPIQGIIDLFDQFPIVALGEGSHLNLQGAAFRLSLIKDPRFSEKVDDIVVEFGTGAYQDVMDRYIAGDEVAPDSLRRCWQETTQPFIWDAPIYAEFFAAVRALNESLPEERRLRVLLGEPPIDWTRIHSREDLEDWYKANMIKRTWGSVTARDGHAVDVVEREVLGKGRKALVIYGDGHFQRVEIQMGGFWGDYFKGMFVPQLERLHPGSVFSIKTLTDTDRLERRYPGIASWPRPSLVSLEETGVGALVIRGEHTLEERFDALLWLGPSSTIGYSEPLPDAVADEAYFHEMLRRDALWMNQWQKELRELRQRYLQDGSDPPEGKHVIIGEEMSLPSRILEREMTLKIALPESYTKTNARYPVLYTFQSFFHHVSGIAAYMPRVNFAPEMIVVSVESYSSSDLSPEKVASNPDSGGADRFIRFFHDELFPFIEARYRTEPYRLLYSGSFGGGFAVYCALSQPDTFHAYIAATPSIDFEGQSQLIPANVEALVSKAAFRNRFLFMALEDWPALARTLDTFTAELRRLDPPGLAWEYHHWPEEDHGSIPHRAIFQGLRSAFSRWSRIPEDVIAEGLDGIASYRRQVSAWYGIDLGLSRGALFQALQYHRERKNYQEAIGIARLMIGMYPDNAFGHRALGRAYEHAGQLDQALTAYERAYEKAVESSSPHLGVFKGSLEGIRKKLQAEATSDVP